MNDMPLIYLWLIIRGVIEEALISTDIAMPLLTHIKYNS